MPLQQMNFKTGIFAGTKTRESTGEGLARLLLKGIDTASKIKSIHDKDLEDEKRKEYNKIKANKEAKREQDEQDYISYLDSKNRYKEDLNKARLDGLVDTSDDLLEWNKGYKDNADVLFMNPDSKYKRMYISTLNDSDTMAVTMKKKENEAAYNNMLGQGISNLNASDFKGLDDLRKFTENGKSLKPSATLDDTITSVMSHTKDNMNRAYVDKTEYIKENGSAPTYEEIVEKYGGETFSQIENKNLTAYKEFEKQASLIAKDFSEAG